LNYRREWQRHPKIDWGAIKCDPIRYDPCDRQTCVRGMCINVSVILYFFMAFSVATATLQQEYGISMAGRSLGCGCCNCNCESLATTTSCTVRLKPTRQAIKISHAPLEPRCRRSWQRCQRHLRLIKQIIACLMLRALLQVAVQIAFDLNRAYAVWPMPRNLTMKS